MLGLWTQVLELSQQALRPLGHFSRSSLLSDVSLSEKPTWSRKFYDSLYWAHTAPSSTSLKTFKVAAPPGFLFSGVAVMGWNLRIPVFAPWFHNQNEICLARLTYNVPDVHFYILRDPVNRSKQTMTEPLCLLFSSFYPILAQPQLRSAPKSLLRLYDPVPFFY